MQVPLCIILSCYTVYAASIQGQIIPITGILDTISSLPSSTKIYIHGEKDSKSTWLKADGSFMLQNVDSGSYVLSVAVIEYDIPPVRIDVAEDDTVQAYDIYLGTNPQELGPSRAYPLILQPTRRISFIKVYKRVANVRISLH